MTNEETAVVKADAPDEYGTREEVQALALRIQHTPLGKGFNQEECWGIAQYARVMDLNPFRGEFYPMRGKDGKIHFVDGYKALVRWAKTEAPYSEDYEALELQDGELHRFRCRIMRDDRMPMIAKYKQLGATFKEAYDIVTTFSDGVVLEKETVSRNGHPIDPPKGWTWKQVTRKRALKNALNLSHGAPSPKQIAQASYLVNGTDTTLEDWEGTEELKYPEERERLALLRAQDRERRAEWETRTPEQHQATLKENVNMMRAPEDFEGYGDEPTTTIDQPTTQKKKPPGTEDQPAKQNQARIKSKGWNDAARGLVAEIGYYTLQGIDGPNWAHLCGAAYKMGYPEVTDDNLKDVIEALAMYAEDQQAMTAENEGPSPAPPYVGPENGEQAQPELPLEG